MPGLVTLPRGIGRIGLAVAVAATVALGGFALRADQNVAGAQAALTALDLAVGFAFTAAGFAGTGPLPERLLVGAVGPAWLAGSVFGWALSMHQSVLAIALLAYPGGRVRGPFRMLLAAGAVVVALEVVPQLAVAALFALTAAAAIGVSPAAPRRAAVMYPVFAGGAVAIMLCFAWWSVEHSAVSSPLVDYETTLLAVAVGFPLASRTAARSRAHLADRVLGEAGATGPAGIAGLQVVLAAALDDPDLRIELDEESTGGADGFAADIAGGAGSTTVVPVFDAGQLVARVITASSSIADRPTSDAVAAAVRLVARNEQLRELNLARVRQLEAARARLLAAGDRERERTAARLRAETGRYLQDALNDLGAGYPVADPDLAAVFDLARGQIAAAAEQVQRIVAGAPPIALGSGQLPAAIAGLAVSCPVSATVDVNGNVAADIAVETTLFYVCSEALANVTKHSAASRVVIVLRREVDRVVLSVTDDGVGGADPDGSGLRGLADRLSAVGGHLLVSSPAGRGTTLRALITLPGV